MLNLIERELPEIKTYYTHFWKSYRSVPSDQKHNNLLKRLENYQFFFDKEYLKFQQQCRKKIIDVEFSIYVSRDYSAWMSAWLQFTWSMVFDEIELLRQGMLLEYKEKTQYLINILPVKRKRYKELLSFLKKLELNPESVGSSEKLYYEKSKIEQENEIHLMEQDLADARIVIEKAINYAFNVDELSEYFVFFLRGSISRKELTFPSDIDFGYCVDNTPENVLDYKFIQELIKRFEELLNALPVESAGLYFEIKGDDLKRFNEIGSVYTIPSILESRSMLGNSSLLSRLKDQFQASWIKPELIDYLHNQFTPKKNKGFDLLDLKNGQGGIRHLQTALWSIMISQQLRRGETRYLLDHFRQQKKISRLDVEHILIALNFYLELRNFKFLITDENEEGKTNNLFDEQIVKKYLQVSNRYDLMDQFDQKMIFCIRVIKSLTDDVNEFIQSTNYSEQFNRLILEKQYFSHEIIKYQSVDEKEGLSWLARPELQQKKAEKVLFVDPLELLDLFLNIAKTGARLSHHLEKKLVGNFSQLQALVDQLKSNEIIRFLHQIFTSQYTSVAIEQMWDLMVIDAETENIQTLLGLFIPECNQMRFLRRNTEIHEYPLCVHSNKALERVENELVHIGKNDPEYLDFLDKDSIFALKWSCLFHDVGKINTNLDHEKEGPEMAIQILQRNKWESPSKVLGLIRLLVEHHQSVVKYSRLSMYPEIGINKYLELADRDPRKVLLLYLINVSDYKSVNQLFRKKTAAIEDLFQKTMEIFHQLKKKDTDKTVTKAVNAFLDEKIAEAMKKVGYISLLQRCISENIQDVLIDPLNTISKKSGAVVAEKSDDLQRLIHAYSQSFEDIAAKKTILIEFSNILNRNISLENRTTLIKKHFPNWDWFFTTVPNRLILSLTSEELSHQLSKFVFDESGLFNLSIIKGTAGEYDTLLFWASDSTFQKKLAFILNRKNINIENGKINHVQYRSGKSGVVGFFHISNPGKLELSESDLNASIGNLTIPKPKRKKELEKDRMIHISHYQEDEKGYIVQEMGVNQYSRVSGLFHYVKITTSDQKYRFFKILKAMEDIGIVVKQSTITTIGNQINDYFIFDDKDMQSLDIEKLQTRLDENLKLNYE